MVSTNEQRHTSGVKPQLLPLEPHQWSDGQIKQTFGNSLLSENIVSISGLSNVLWAS